MQTHILHNETLLETYQYKNTTFELIQRKPSIWAGTLGYASNLTDEPDIEGLLKRYQQLPAFPEDCLANPAWDACISIDYWQNGAAPRGMLFGREVLPGKELPGYDLYEMPESLYIRVLCSTEAALNLLGKAECGVWELFGCIREVMEIHGYTGNDNGAQEIEMYNHGAGIAYAYTQVKKQG